MHSIGTIERNHAGGPFTKAEKEQLIKALAEHGHENHDKLIQAGPTRTPYAFWPQIALCAVACAFNYGQQEGSVRLREEASRDS